MLTWLRRLFPRRVRIAQPRTVRKHGDLTESRTGLAVHFHFAPAPPRTKAPAQPKGDRPTPLKDWLLGAKPPALTRAQVRALPLVRRAAAPAHPLAAAQALTGEAFPTRQTVARVRAERADRAAIATMQARYAAAAQRRATPQRKAPARPQPVAVAAHTRAGTAVAAHTRQKPGTAPAERTAK